MAAETWRELAALCQDRPSFTLRGSKKRGGGGGGGEGGGGGGREGGEASNHVNCDQDVTKLRTL
jgi:hypothetical protein